MSKLKELEEWVRGQYNKELAAMIEATEKHAKANYTPEELKEISGDYQALQRANAGFGVAESGIIFECNFK